MKSLLVALAACVLMASGAGCHHNLTRNNCGSCGNCPNSCMTGCKHCGLGHNGTGQNCLGHSGHVQGVHGHGGLHNGSLCQPGPVGWQHGGTDNIPRLPNNVYGNHVGFIGAGGPPSPTVGYPYYTTRGPRDFLMDNPPSVGR